MFETIDYTHEDKGDLILVFWTELNLKFMWSESQYSEFVKSFILKQKESIKISPIKPSDSFSHYFCSVEFPGNRPSVSFWIPTSTIQRLLKKIK